MHTQAHHATTAQRACSGHTMTCNGQAVRTRSARAVQAGGGTGCTRGARTEHAEGHGRASARCPRTSPPPPPAPPHSLPVSAFSQGLHQVPVLHEGHRHPAPPRTGSARTAPARRPFPPAPLGPAPRCARTRSPAPRPAPPAPKAPKGRETAPGPPRLHPRHGDPSEPNGENKPSTTEGKKKQISVIPL